jgi:pimeloyl-ACP methyl ester carboxylesterase
MAARCRYPYVATHLVFRCSFCIRFRWVHGADCRLPWVVHATRHLAEWPQAGSALLLAQGNRNMALALHKAANVAGLRIIAPDRPSIGSSTPLDGRTVQSYCTDLAELADQLQAPCFGLMAVSAGAMYALAATLAPQTAHRVRGRVRCMMNTNEAAPTPHRFS